MLWGTLHAPLARFNLPIGVLHFQFMGNGIYGKTVFQDQLPTPLAQLPEVMKECYHCLQALWNFTQTVTFSRVFQVSMWLLRKCFWSEQCKTCYKDQKKKKQNKRTTIIHIYGRAIDFMTRAFVPTRGHIYFVNLWLLPFIIFFTYTSRRFTGLSTLPRVGGISSS